MKFSLPLYLLIVLFLSSCVQREQPSQIQAYTAEGNLEARSPVTCVAIAQLATSHTAADIFAGVKTCLAQKNYAQAAKLFLVAGTYGYFDTLRVADRTAHQALIVMRMETFAERAPNEIELLQTELNALLADNQHICRQLRAVGQPNYYPKYMIQHGMRAFTGSGENDQNPSFDAESAWKDSLRTVAKCEVS